MSVVRVLDREHLTSNPAQQTGPRLRVCERKDSCNGNENYPYGHRWPGRTSPPLKTRFVAEIHSTAYGRADFLYEGGGFVSVTLPKEQWEDMGTPGTVTITVEPGNVLEAEAEAGDGIEDDPIIGLPDTAKTLFDGMVDYYQVLKETRPQDAEDFIRGFIWWPLAKFLADHE